MLAPINRIPPEVLTLIPDSSEKSYKNRGVIPLTHVCRAWRKVFISHSPLWTHFDCKNADKMRVYLERSRSSPISLQMHRKGDLSPHHPLFQVIPHAATRLKTLSVRTSPENIGHIITHLSRPSPPLQYLSIDCGPGLGSKPVLTTALFDGNLSSLRDLCLLNVHTALPWRNMVNLTSFTLGYTSPRGVSIGQILDFLESAPRLESVELRYATPTSGAQDGRLVSLPCLKSMRIRKGEPCSLLLDHLLVPVGAELAIRADSIALRLERHLPRSLDNLGNLSGSMEINLNFEEFRPKARFSGPNGQVSVAFQFPRVNLTFPVLEYLAWIDTSKTERLEIKNGDSPSRDLAHRALLRMKNLRTLSLSRCQNSHFIHALHPDTGSSEAVVCPKLEELIFVPRITGERTDIENLTDMTTARALCGATLKTIRFFGTLGNLYQDSLSELRKHVLHVEYVPWIGASDDDSDDSDEEDGDSDGSDDSDDDWW